MIVWQWPTALAVGPGECCLAFFPPRLSFLSSSSLSVGDGPFWTEILSQRGCYTKNNLPKRKIPISDGYRSYTSHSRFADAEASAERIETKIAEFANSVDLDEVAHKEPAHLHLHSMPSRL